MKRILVGFIMDGNAGGIDKYLLNFLNTVQNKDIKIDFLTDEIHEELKEYLKKRDSEIYAIAGLRHPIKQYRQVIEILKKKNYDMIYLNVSTAIDCVAAFAAKKMGVSTRAIHSHSSGNDCENSLQRFIYNCVHRICKLFFYRAGTMYYGCSIKAGRWIFPKKIVESDRFEVVYNAVDRTTFEYDRYLRQEIRKELGLQGKYVIGHVGNFCYQKNYPFLINVFEEFHKTYNEAYLLLVGKGVEFDEIQRMVKEKNLQNYVKFMGWRKDTHRLYQAMDTFLMPSRFEGLPIVGIEAQTTKLQCIFSDNVTEETKIQDRTFFFSLKENPKKWAEFILQYKEYDREKVKMLEQAEKYDLENQKKQLKEIVCRK